MHNNYVDRGMMKWAPFNALDGYFNLLDELKRGLRKISKPELSEDQYEELDRILKDAMLEQSEIAVKYYENGYVKISFGRIKKVDPIEKMIVLTTYEKISAHDVMEMEIIC